MLVATIFFVFLVERTICFDVPRAVLSTDSNGGLTVTFDDRAGINLIGWHYSVNKKLSGTAPGQINVDIRSKTGSKWVYTNSRAGIRSGDTVNFWYMVVVNGYGHLRTNLYWKNSGKPPGPTKKPPGPTSKPPNNGDLIFEDNFNFLDNKKWSHRIEGLGCCGNNEFQLYTNNRKNSFCKNGKLFIQPTISNRPSGRISTPVVSARLNTKRTFNFQYGSLEIEAKMPTGDWIWPALWLMPRDSSYGTWPASGEIDLMEARGNENLFNSRGHHKGIKEMGSTMHWGPKYPYNGFTKTHGSKYLSSGSWGTSFHRYQLEWGPDIGLKFGVDDQTILTVNPREGFWKYGKNFWRNWDDSKNPWKRGTRLAPFDKPFYIIMNVAVGGTNYFSDSYTNKPYPKPWKNNRGDAIADFYRAKNKWLPTWKGENAAMQVNYVRVWKRK